MINHEALVLELLVQCYHRNQFLQNYLEKILVFVLEDLKYLEVKSDLDEGNFIPIIFLDTNKVSTNFQILTCFDLKTKDFIIYL